MNNMDKFFENFRKNIPQIAEEATQNALKELALTRQDKAEAFLLIASNEFNCLPQNEKELWTENEYLIMRSCMRARSESELVLLKVLLEKHLEKSPKLRTVLNVINNDERINEDIGLEYYKFTLEKLLWA